MTVEEASNGNELIAQFMGYQILNKKYQERNYNSSNEFYYEWNEGEIVCDKYGNEVNLPNGDDPIYFLDELPFDSSYDWLIPVVEKIENLTFGNTTQFDVVIDKRGCCITQYFYGGEHHRWQTGLYNSLNKIESIWTCVVSFIKWYNTIEDESK